MKPLGEAQRQVLAALPLLPVVPVPLEEAAGLVLAQRVVAPHAIPPFANSAVDGFAVRAADTDSVPVDLAVAEDVPAGRSPRKSVTEGIAIRIMTGAPIPAGADAVVRVEDTEATPRGGVRILARVGPQTAIRPAGGDVTAGFEVFQVGVRLGPAHLAMLATLGVAQPLVRRRPKVAVMSTGDELVPYGEARLAPAKIRDSNRPLVKALLAELGVEIVDLGIVPDDPAALRAALSEGTKADAIVTTGGVSMGEHDLVKAVLSELGTVEMWQVAMQPAKPFAFGSVNGVPLFGLPGNPVSVMVAFEQFVRPGLLHMMGARRLFRPRQTGRMAERVATDSAKTVFLRVALSRREGETWASLSGGQASNVLSALAAADAFAVVPDGRGTVLEGEPVELEMFRSEEQRSAEEVWS